MPQYPALSYAADVDRSAPEQAAEMVPGPLPPADRLDRGGLLVRRAAHGARRPGGPARRAVAIGERDGAPAGLAAVEAVAWLDHHRCGAAADPAGPVGRGEASWREALTGEPNEATRRFLRQKLDGVS